eukprot:XP_001709929.1 Hypothetical protein GL50803_87986 [Giardia lamblia ATCC 50803]
MRKCVEAAAESVRSKASQAAGMSSPKTQFPPPSAMDFRTIVLVSGEEASQAEIACGESNILERVDVIPLRYAYLLVAVRVGSMF